jgi:hypothetical protein
MRTIHLTLSESDAVIAVFAEHITLLHPLTPYNCMAEDCKRTVVWLTNNNANIVVKESAETIKNLCMMG